MRFTRQIRLAEVGEAGQARLASGRVPLATGSFVEERYLTAAGITVIAGRGDRPPDLGLRHAAAAEVGQGALAALIAMRTLLGIG